MRVSPGCVALSLIGLFPLLTNAENLLENASFEQPPVKGRVSELKGANPSRVEGKTGWAHYESLDQKGMITIGMSDEMARTGKQSIFVDFAKAEKARSAFLMTDVISIKPSATYRVSIWGRMDPKRPLTLAHARPMLRLEVEFYQADLETQTGDTEFRTQMIPGSARRLLFLTSGWNEYFSEFKAPEDAAVMKITFRWEPPGEKGQADGLIYFDDVVVDGPAGPAIVEPQEPGTLPATPAAPGASPSAK